MSPRRSTRRALARLLAASLFAGAPEVARASAGGGIDVRSVSPESALGEVGGEVIRTRDLEPRSLAALAALWNQILEAKRSAKERLEADLVAREAGIERAEAAIADTQEGLLEAIRRERDAEALRLAEARASLQIDETAPREAADSETRWPEVVARVGATTLRDEDLEEAARLRLSRLRARVHAELVRAFEAEADARRLAIEARRVGSQAHVLVDRARAGARPVTEAEVDATVSERRARGAEARPDRVRAYLEGRRRAEAELALRDRLRGEIPGRFLVVAPEPPRLPARGALPRAGEARVVVLAFTGLRCHHCAATERILSDLEAGPWRGRIRIERRAHFPEALLPALEDAVALRCAAAQNRAAELRRAILDALASKRSANSWAIGRASVPDANAFERCRRDPAVVAAVLDERAEAEALGFDDTPSFLVNGLPRVGFQPRDRLESLIAEALAGAPPDRLPSSNGEPS